MTEESAKGKLTLSGKSTLTLKNLNKSPAADGKKQQAQPQQADPLAAAENSII